MTAEELIGQITWFQELRDSMNRKEYKIVEECIENALKLLERQKDLVRQIGG